MEIGLTASVNKYVAVTWNGVHLAALYESVGSDRNEAGEAPRYTIS